LTKKIIYLVRHGQTEYNKLGIVQGGTIDAPLNQTGLAQAEAFWQQHKEVKFDKIYTSTLKRSIQSVQKFIDLGIPWQQEKGLNEISWGDYDGQKIYEDDYYWQVVNAWNTGQVSLKIKGGESPVDVVNRQIPVIEQLQNDPAQKILICMHGRAMRILLSNFIDQDLTKMDTYEHHNLGLYLLELDENGFKIITEAE
jgi:broad specificity phosphatase PhoE